VLFNLIQTAVLVANKMTLLLPLFLLGSGDYLKAFSPEQLQALTYVSLRLPDYGFGFGLIFFGMECIVLGWLIARSKYLPRPIGLLMQLAGVCYLTNSFALILDPELGAIISGDSAAAVHRGIVACPVAASERRRAVEMGGAARAQKRVNVALIVRLTAFRSITSRRDDPGGPCIAS
jgi:hypothetical protein